MKKVILSVAALLVFGFSNAQVKFGAKVGLNVSNLNYTVDTPGAVNPTTSAMVGFHIGGLAEIKLTDKFAIQPELLFSTQGGKTSASQDMGGGDTFSVENKVNLSYLNIPIMVKYYVINKLSIEAGPQIGFLMAAKATRTATDMTNGVTTFSASDKPDVKSIYKSIDFGVNVGASYDITEHIFAGVTYNIGLSDISQAGIVTSFGETTVETKDYKEKNGVFQISFGYKL